MTQQNDNDNNYIGIRINAQEFMQLSQLIKSHFGIHLTETKKSLIEGRFQKVLKKLNLFTFKDYLAYLNMPGQNTTQKLGELIDRISTNHTFFHREASHFDFLEKVILPEIKAKNQTSKRIRMWCAASSYGQEPYTLAMRMMKFFGPDYKNWDAGLLASDISEEALNIAIEGIYDANDVQQLPQEWVKFGFKPLGDGRFQVLDSIRKEVTYRRFNLMNDLPFKSNFDIVFCRNVMIYFDDPTKEALVKRIYDKMNPGGYFVVSLSESLKRNSCPFNYVSPGVYQK